MAAWSVAKKQQAEFSEFPGAKRGLETIRDRRHPSMLPTVESVFLPCTYGGQGG